MESEGKGLGKPVGVTGHRTEDDTTDNDVVKMRNEEQAIVEYKVSRRDGHQHAGHSADHKRDYKTDRPMHRGGESDAAAIHCKQPIEDFDTRRYSDDHRRNSKECVHI